MTDKETSHTSGTSANKEQSATEATHIINAKENTPEETIAPQIKNAHAAGTGTIGRNEEKQPGANECSTSGADEY